MDKFITFEGVGFNATWAKEIGFPAFLDHEMKDSNRWPDLSPADREQLITQAYQAITGEVPKSAAPLAKAKNTDAASEVKDQGQE